MSSAFFLLSVMKQVTLLFLSLLLLTACHRSQEPLRLEGEVQGSYYSIIYYDTQQRDFSPQIDSIFALLDSSVNLWVDNSIIRRVNSGKDSVVNHLFVDMYNKSSQIKQYTNGCFNCEIGALVNLYGFGFKNRVDIVDAQIDSLLVPIRNSQISIDCEGESRWTIRNRPQQVEFDFNAIAQGYTVDLIARLFDQNGLESYLIFVGGEVIAKGVKPNGDHWTVGVERPAADKYDQPNIETAMYLDDMSVVTSGNYRKYYEKDGLRFSHTIDPATGRPVSHSLLSATVVSRESWYADAMATAFMVMGLERSLQFIADHPEDTDIQAAFFIYDENGQYSTYATPQFMQLIKEQ